MNYKNYRDASFANTENIIDICENMQGSETIFLDPLTIRQCARIAYYAYNINIEKLYDEGFFDIGYWDYNRLSHTNHGIFANIIGSIGKTISQKVMDGISINPARGNTRALIAVKRDKKYIVIVGISGSIQLLSDWMINADMHIMNDMHRGFYKNALDFIDNFKNIHFPELSKELSSETLSLYDIINECKEENSRFIVLFCGHSKGAALSQIIVKELIDNRNVKNILAMAYASPRVSCLKNTNLSKYPIINIISKDDLVTKMGGHSHIGMVLEYKPKNTVYDGPFKDEITKKDAEYFFRFWHNIKDTSCGISLIYAIVSNIKDMGLPNKYDIVINILEIASNIKEALNVIDTYNESLKEQHNDIYGQDIPEETLEYFVAKVKEFANVSESNFFAAFLKMFKATHAISNKEELAPYDYIASYCSDPNLYYYIGIYPKNSRRIVVSKNKRVQKTEKKKKREKKYFGKLKNAK